MFLFVEFTDPPLSVSSLSLPVSLSVCLRLVDRYSDLKLLPCVIRVHSVSLLCHNHPPALTRPALSRSTTGPQGQVRLCPDTEAAAKGTVSPTTTEDHGQSQITTTTVSWLSDKVGGGGGDEEGERVRTGGSTTVPL